MSDENQDSKNPILSAIGTIFIFLVPAALIVMLGIVGAAFLGGTGVEVAEKPEETAAPATVAATTETDPAPTEATAPAEGGAAAETAAAAPAAGGIDPAVMELGKASYMTCAACHGPDGQGLKAGPMLMAPSLTGSELLLGDPDQALLIILKGIAKENMDFMGMMASLGAALDDEKLAAVLTYTRNSWGNSAPAITKEQAAAARAKFADVEAPAGVSRAKIKEIVDAHK
jgi:mono/diheme cytochrome c family protein